MKIKEKIKTSDNMLIQGALVIRKLFKDEEFIDWIKGYDENFYAVRFKALGEENKDKNICIFRFDNRAFGFFAYWKFGLLALDFADRHNFIPVFDWTTNSVYCEKENEDFCNNPFEYYYKQYKDITLKRAENSYNVYEVTKWSEEMYKKATYDSEINFENFATLVKKYYILNDSIKEKLNGDINSLLGLKKTLAVQVRGVDWGNIKGHPIPPSLDIYIEEIDKALEKCHFEQIILATDSEDTVEYISNKYPNKVIVYSDVARASKGSKTLAIFDNTIKRENNKFLLGYEVLRDMHTLASCAGLVASLSNVSLAAEVTKKSWDQEYEYKHIINAELNRNGFTGIAATDLQRQGKFKG